MSANNPLDFDSLSDQAKELVQKMVHEEATSADKQLELLSLFRSTLVADRSKSYADWFKSNVVSAESAISSHYDIDMTPYFKKPCEDYLKDGGVHQINIAAPTGGGKSAFFTALLNYNAVHSPATTLVVFQTSTEATDFAQSRLYPTFRSNPRMEGVLPSKRDGQRKSEILFPHMSLWMRGASDTQLQSKSVTRLIGDEVFLWRAGALAQAKARLHDRHDKKILLVSQGGDTDSEWCAAYNSGSRFEWNFKCPKCGKFSELSFDYLVTDEFEPGTPVSTKAQSTKLECPKCKTKFDDTAANRRKIASSGRYIQETSSGMGVVSYHLEALAMYRVPWSTLMAEYLEACYKKDVDGDPTSYANFMFKRRALFISPDQASAGEEGVNVVIPIKTGAYPMKEIPKEGVLLKMLTCDVQGTHYWWAVSCVLETGELLAVDCGAALTPEELQELAVKYDIGRNVFLDAAWNTEEVRATCHEYNWWPMNATNTDKTVKKGKRKEISTPFDRVQVKARAPHGVYNIYQYNFSSRRAKDAVLRLSRGEKLLCPVDMPPQFESQLASEACVTSRITHEGTAKYVRAWKETKNNNSHLLDCMAMAYMVAVINGVY